MNDDSDHDVTELEIETRTWNKLETRMKLFGFREGAVEGKNLSLQKGFNLGYIDGFQLGEYLGMHKGVINCESELKVSDQKAHTEEQGMEVATSQPCVLCLSEKSKKTVQDQEMPHENLEDLVKLQQSHNKKIMKALKVCDLKSYFDKG